MRKLQITAAAVALLLFFSSTSDAQIFDVTKYGAKADGKSNIDKALMSVWKLACASTSPSKIVIPKGTYLLGEVKIQGPCKAPVEIQVQEDSRNTDGIHIGRSDGIYITDSTIGTGDDCISLGDGSRQTLMSVWKLACASTSPSKIVIPKGTFLLGEVKIQGPCKAPVEIQVQGTVKAPADPSSFKTDGWLTFNYIDKFTLSGGGVFDGQGKIAWEQNDCHNNTNCKRTPVVSFYIKN
ncbi:hypothetical protein CRG98_009899 [Punica granatum]|uniref:Uncharacterized protein n=1 Tax=Punica granatum TaxID=22663 RepID=A0A2I0KN80_PUNGR|nr:hypothetical protein CRG98_009899 [Punica granatum]